MSISSSPQVHARPLAAWSAPARARWRRAPRAVRLAAALAGLVAIGAYLIVALSRLGYPFAIESLEGNSLVEVHRILAGQPLYTAPAAGYVPDGYPPLYFAVSAGAARVLGLSYLPLRLVSLLSSLACFALLARLVQRETGSLAAGTGAAGLLAATYFVTRTWFDVARVDTLFLALSLAGLYAARQMRGTGGAVVAGLLLAAAALTKQTGLAEGAVVLAVLLTGPRRRLACIAALTEAAVVGVSTLILGLASGGWYIFYVFRLMSEHSLTASHFGWFWKVLFAGLGLAVCAALVSARRVPRELLAGAAALAVEGYAALVHSGGNLNDMLPAYLAVALLAGLALGTDTTWWASTAAALLALAQTVFLLAGAHPSQAVPASSSRAAGERLLAGMRAFGGDVAVPDEPALSLAAGMAPAGHPDAVHDVLRGTDRAAIAAYRRSTREAVRARQFSAIITDRPGLPLDNPPGFLQDYQECVQPLTARSQVTLPVPVSQRRARSVSVWIPRGSGSCQDAIRTLSGEGRS